MGHLILKNDFMGGGWLKLVSNCPLDLDRLKTKIHKAIENFWGSEKLS